jgi:uncharacterized iron-regulated membrane protein
LARLAIKNSLKAIRPALRILLSPRNLPADCRISLARRARFGNRLQKYRGGKAVALKKDSGMIIIPGPQTNHYFVTTTYTEKTFTMDGKLVHEQYNFRALLKCLHERGWIGTRLGSWLADIVACAMVFFSLSGLIMWSVPRPADLFSSCERDRV